MAAIRYYVDVNCITYCLVPAIPKWTPAGLKTLRGYLFGAVKRGELIVIGSQFHIEEASRIDDRQRPSWMRFFWDIVGWSLLLSTSELAVLEAKHGRPLRGNEPYEEYGSRQILRDKTLRFPQLDQLALTVERSVLDAEGRLRNLRDKSKADIALRFKNVSAHKVTEEWWSESVDHIADWMRDYMRASRDRLGLPRDESAWPDPQQLRTAWAMHAYQMARIVMTVGMGRKVRGSDVHDAHHYAMASYADVLVTQDGGFAETVGLIPNALRVIDFNTFAAELGVSPT